MQYLFLLLRVFFYSFLSFLSRITSYQSKKPKLDHVNPSKDNTDTNSKKAMEVGRPAKDCQTTFTMVSPDMEDHRLPPTAQDKASSWPSGCINPTLAARFLQELGAGAFTICGPAIQNPYLSKKQLS
jgi:hypothetical protein